MAKRKKYNPEQKTWKGVSWRRTGKRVKQLREKQDAKLSAG